MVFHPISIIAEILNVYYTLDPFGCKHLEIGAPVHGTNVSDGGGQENIHLFLIRKMRRNRNPFLIAYRPPIIDFGKNAMIKNYALLFCANPGPCGFTC
jgi:hypothetical protein